jgi:CobW/HypB/UreG, nucleotide-binding domain
MHTITTTMTMNTACCSSKTWATWSAPRSGTWAKRPRSVTEGEDKPLKYPDMFAAAQLMVLNKTDLLPHVKFDIAHCIELARRVNPAIEIIQLSATTGEGMDAWLHWLDHAMGSHHHHHDEPVSEEAALRERVKQLEAELAKAKAQMSPHAPPLRGSLPPEGERFALGRPGGETVTG